MKELVVIGAAVIGGIAVLHLGKSNAATAAAAAQTAGTTGVPTAAQPATGAVHSVAGSPIVLKPGELAPAAGPMIGAPTKAVAGSTAPNPVAPILPGITGYYQIASSIAAAGAGGTTAPIKRTATTTPKELAQQIMLVGPQIGAIW